MRTAPPVSVRCSGGLAWRWLQTLLFTWAAAALGVWTVQMFELPLSAAALAALLVGSVAWWRTRPRVVDLVWNGQHWAANGMAGRLDVVFDIGPCMLLRLKPDGGGRACWIPLTQAELGAALHGLRVAAYSRVPAVTPAVKPAALGSP